MDQESDFHVELGVDEEIEKEIDDLAITHAKKMSKDDELLNLKQRILFLELKIKELEEKLQNSFTQYPPVYSMPYYPQNTPDTPGYFPEFLMGMSNGEITYYNK